MTNNPMTHYSIGAEQAVLGCLMHNTDHGSASNNSYSFSQQDYITAPDAVAAGNNVADRTQEQMRDARRMYSGNGQ